MVEGHEERDRSQQGLSTLGILYHAVKNSVCVRAHARECVCEIC